MKVAQQDTAITPNGADVVIIVQSYSGGQIIFYSSTQVTSANQTITIQA